MAASSGTKLFKIASQLNIGRDAIVDYLNSKGLSIENKPTSVLTDEMVDLVMEKFSKELKTAEKQREKVERQKAVRTKLMEHGSTVSLHDDEQPVQQAAATPKAEEKHAPEVAPPAAPAAEAPAAQEAAPAPEAPAPAATPAAPEAPAVPATGMVIDLGRAKQEEKRQRAEQAIGKKQKAEAAVAFATKKDEKPEEQPVAATTDAPAGADVAAPAPPAAVEAAAPAAAESAQAEPPAGETTEGEHVEGEKRPRKRRQVIEVEYKPGTAPQLKGLTVLGKVELAPPRPKREERPQRGPGGRPGGPGGQGGTRPGGGERRTGPGSGRATIGDAMRGGGGGGGSDSSGPNFRRPAAAPASARKDDKNKKKNTKGMRDQFSPSDVERKIRETLAGRDDAASTRAKLRQKKRTQREEKEQIRQEELARESTTLQLSEFVTTADLANLMGVAAPEIIVKCMGLGLMVSINQRLDRDTIILIASDYGFEVNFLDDKTVQDVEDTEDAPETLKPRSPIVTIMGHVDHGKTSLLDYIRNANVVAGEAGGITQHIGAYRVETATGRTITFLDTPGHEAFTAMRARGAQVTDIVVLVVAADDAVMPQTIEAISHAQAANVPMVIAINKADKPDANPDRIRQQLSDQGVLVEEWGGKYQSVELSAKTGMNVDLLLEKIGIESDILDLKANPDRAARGTVVEAHVDKGRGNVVTVIVQKGTLDVGDIFVCGQFAGRVRAMTDERGHRIDSAGPSWPVQVTGFDGLPDAGDILIEMETDAEAREVANHRQQLRREQALRGMRHMTLDQLSAQIAQGGVKELRLVVKADVSGSVEALTDSLLKLSHGEVAVRILHRAVGAITESDIMLAAASEAIIVGFQVNVSTAARKLAEAEEVDVRLYSIIYDCINEVQLALEGMLTPDIKEEKTSEVEVRQIFKISRLGTIAGCYVTSGTITRNDKVRVMRDGFEIYKGTLTSLKRVKDDVREVDTGYECGIGIQGFNDMEVGDIIESYKTIEVKRKLA
jgi:translation initiation factor IF-2